MGGALNRKEWKEDKVDRAMARTRWEEGKGRESEF